MTDHKNVYMALAAAQMEMGPVVKGAINPAFKGEGKPKGTSYADLADVMAAVLPALNKHGIALFHYLKVEAGTRFMVAALVHGATGTSIECPVELILGKNDMQGFKSATTYAKRIGTESLTGVAPEDDDGNAAARNAPPEIATISEPQFLQLRHMLAKSGADENKLLSYFGIPALHSMPAVKFSTAEAMLQKKIDAKKETAVDA